MNFIRFRFLYFLASLVVIIPGVYSLIRWGIKPSIDFTGGSIIEIKSPSFASSFAKATEDEKATEGRQKSKVFEIVKDEGSELVSIQSSGKNLYLLKMGEINEEQKQKLLERMKEQFGEVEEVRFETVGPTLGKELLLKTLLAVILATGFILLYVAFSFKDKKYGICAVLGMLHDTLILLGVFSLLGHFKGVEVDTLFVTAVLTTLSLSVHDTVVVFNKIRESVRNYPEISFASLIDKAITETLVRSINNSLTIIFMLSCLYLLGGETIKWFVLALLVGTLAGTYSSTFIAAPLLLVWEDIFRRKS